MNFETEYQQKSGDSGGSLLGTLSTLGTREILGVLRVLGVLTQGIQFRSSNGKITKFKRNQMGIFINSSSKWENQLTHASTSIIISYRMGLGDGGRGPVPREVKPWVCTPVGCRTYSASCHNLPVHLPRAKRGRLQCEGMSSKQLLT